MEDSENKIQINDSKIDIEHLNNLINSQNDEIDHLNNKLNDLRRLLFNQLSDIKEISNSNKSIVDTFESLKMENVQLNDLVNGEFESLKMENVQLNDLVNGEFESLKMENVQLNKEFESLKMENKRLKDTIKKHDKNNQKILESYKENFKFLFYCYDLQPKSLLKNIWDVCQEVLDLVVNVCEKYGIEYWLEAGSLLGAVRHEGFLPWDDDIDLGMMRKDYNRFQEVFDLELKNLGLDKKIRWTLLRHENNILYFLQISYAGFAILDIFPYDYTNKPLDNMEELYFSEKAKFKTNIKEGKSYSEAIKELYENLNLSFDKQDYVVSGVERSVRGRFYLQEVDKIFPLSKVSFQGKEYSGLNDNDLHLTKLYGNWRDLPKVLDRHNRIYKLKERKNIDEFLSQKINDLREVNENFND